LYRSYFKGISANIDLQVFSAACCTDRTDRKYS
jgi:hypothetical protein